MQILLQGKSLQTEHIWFHGIVCLNLCLSSFSHVQSQDDGWQQAQLCVVTFLDISITLAIFQKVILIFLVLFACCFVLWIFFHLALSQDAIGASLISCHLPDCYYIIAQSQCLCKKILQPIWAYTFNFTVYGLATIGRGRKYVLCFDKRNQTLFSMLTLVC